MPRANLELGRAYCWKVTGGIKCDVWEHGSTVGGVCPTCGKNQAAGADRTGALAYVLNGVLGVSRHDLEVEWESTFYPRLPEMKNRNGWNVKRHFDEGFAKYGADGGTWQRRIELYLLLDCGVTEAEIAAFKSIMLE